MQMAQVMQNLIGNAIKFHGDERPKIHIHASPEVEREWTFAVKDNGIGLNMEYADKIFQMFQRLTLKGRSTPAPASVWRSPRRSWSGMAAVSGSNRKRGREPFFTLPCLDRRDQFSEPFHILLIEDSKSDDKLITELIAVD